MKPKRGAAVGVGGKGSTAAVKASRRKPRLHFYMLGAVNVCLNAASSWQPTSVAPLPNLVSASEVEGLSRRRAFRSSASCPTKLCTRSAILHVLFKGLSHSALLKIRWRYDWLTIRLYPLFQAGPCTLIRHDMLRKGRCGAATSQQAMSSNVQW